MKKTTLGALALFSMVAFAADAPLPPELMQAKTVYVLKAVNATNTSKKDAAGNDSFVQQYRDELSKWGRFSVVSDPKDADLIVLVGERVQTSYMTINNQTRSSGSGNAYLEVIQPSSRKILWTGAKNVGLSWSTKSLAAGLVKQLRKKIEAQEAADGKAK